MPNIRFESITQIFGDVVACRNISIDISHGQIHAIIGENGAGKSTLVKMLGGLYQATSGQIFINNQIYSPRSAQDAFSQKIAFIHQHFVLAEQMTALENLELSFTSHQFALRPRQAKTLAEKAAELLKQFNWKLNLESPVEKLSVGEQQRLEILKALLLEPEIIIFDEPTAVLTPQESEELIQFILQLKEVGKTIIIISHKLNEIKSVADQISILRQGQLVVTQPQNELSIERMAELMIGRLLNREIQNHKSEKPHSLFQIPHTKISVNQNEILGIAGIEGNGQTQLIHTILGCFRRLQLRYGDITEDRLKLSVFEEMSLSQHMLVRHDQHFTRYGLIQNDLLQNATQQLLKAWDVRPASPEKILTELSGGNQQKFIVGRELWDNPQVLLAAHPTRGVDLGAQEQIHRSLIHYARAEKAVVLVSSDLDEIMYLSDQYIILNKGKVYGPFYRGQLAEKQIGLLMASENQSDLQPHEAGHV